MPNRDIDPQLLLLRRQYMQLFEPDFLAWPSSKFLKNADVQKWLYRHLFDSNQNPRLPPENYQLCVLKRLVSKIEKGIENSEQDAVLNELVTFLGSFATEEVPSESQSAWGNAYVTFTCIPEKDAPHDGYDDTLEPTITLLERRHLISGSRTTGFRTWEGSLHLSSYLLTGAGSRLVVDKNVLELGAGTGFLTILSAKYLRARHVTTTDGDKGALEALRENLILNGLDDQYNVRTETLTWGQDLRGTWLEDDCRIHPYDVVLGADITYEKPGISALILSLQGLFYMRPKLRVIIAGVVRNVEVFQTFRDECARRQFVVEKIDFNPKPMRQQKALFYASAMPIKILSITRP